MIPPYPPYSLVALVILVAYVLRAIALRLRARSIAHLPGPPSDSWLVGNLPELFRPQEIGDADFKWTESFGTALRIKGIFSSDILFTSDPKALQYVFNTAGYNFPKPNTTRAITSLVTGKGLSWAEGSQHARQRKIMNPAFSYTSLRVFLPLFHSTAQKTVAKWKGLVSQSGNAQSVIDIPSWLARTTLDAIGAAAFDYSFNAINEENTSELAQAYNNLFADSFFNRSNIAIVVEYLLGEIPQWLEPILHRIPTRELRRLHPYMKAARSVARSLVDRQVQSFTAGHEGGKDVMSILVRANLSENSKSKLSDNEIVAQLTTLMLAGHETTANTVSWSLYELSRHPEFQEQVRTEIRETRARATQLGHAELSVADLDSMKCLLALMKETLRYHPIVPALAREAGRDDIIPLSNPQTTRMGEVITAIPVGKGQRVLLSIAAYNRLKSIWGMDADVWRPERFLEGREDHPKTNLGVIANIASFSSGLRSCIGWRFALIEMQAILIELIENFRFSPPPGDVQIVRGAAGLMTPMWIKGSNSGRTALPLTVTPVM